MIGRALVLLPIGHAILCYLYLYFFSLGFGQGVLELATVGDVLSVGLGEILPFYISSLASIILVYLWMDEEPLRLGSDKDATLHPTLEVSWFRKVMIFTLVAIPAFQIILLIFSQKVQLTGLLLGVTGGVAVLVRRAVEVNNWKRRNGLIAIFLFLGVCTVASRAYTNGFKDRTDHFDRFSEQPTICNSTDRFLFSTGNYKIAIQPTGQRVAFDSDCNVRLHFRPQTVTIDLL